MNAGELGDGPIDLETGASLPEPKGEIIGYLIDGKLYHPSDVLIVRAAP